MRIGIPKEKNEKETRVAIVPVSIPKLLKLGFEIYRLRGEERLIHAAHSVPLCTFYQNFRSNSNP